MNIQELTNQFDLTQTHTLALESDSLFFRKIATTHAKASVYLWIACKSDDNYKVLYVGKAGKGVHLRCTQHAGGFANSVTGRKNATELKRYLREGYEVRVYSRQSSVMEIFGQQVSLYSAEEDALCTLLNPVLNRAMFPILDAPAERKESTGTLVQSSESLDVIARLIDNRLIQSTTVSTDDLIAQLDYYTVEQRSDVKELLAYVETQLSPEHRAKLVGGYAGHPKGCSGETALTFAIPGPSGKMKQDTWKARVYFGEEPRIGFPLSRLNASATDKVDIAVNEKTFSPKSSKDFIQHPAAYLV